MESPADEEKIWIQRCLQGDSSAFEGLVKMYYEPSVRIAFSVVRRREDALDVVQNAFLKAYLGLKGFSGQSRFSTWLYRIVMNQAIDWKRRGARRESVSLDTQSASGGSGLERIIEERVLIQPRESPRKAAVDAQIQEHLDLCMESLSEEHRQVILLREVQGLSYEEVAEICECKVGTVMSRLYYAREVLRKKLEKWL